MPWHQLQIALEGADPAAAEAACFALGAVSVSLTDAGDEAILEPAPGETPLWRSVRLQALWPESAEPREVVLRLAATLALDPERIAVERVADRVWEREWLRDFRPMRFGRRLWVCPGGQSPPDPDAIRLELDPGLAFGTGTHATTAMCLEWLEGEAPDGRRVLDYGCGSGILALAALKLGAATATAFDIDPQALLATRENAERNGLAGRLQVAERPETLSGPYDIVMANILAGPLVELAPSFAALSGAGASLVLAGLLDAQAGEVTQAYRPWFDTRTAASREGWTAIAGRRRAE